MDKYIVMNYRRFSDYQHGHGEIILETNSKDDAIKCAKCSNYGGREICSVVKDSVEIFCTLEN